MVLSVGVGVTWVGVNWFIGIKGFGELGGVGLIFMFCLCFFLGCGVYLM